MGAISIKTKMKNIGNGVIDSATQCLRKLFGVNELPISKKAHISPILQNMDWTQLRLDIQYQTG